MHTIFLINRKKQKRDDEALKKKWSLIDCFYVISLYQILLLCIDDYRLLQNHQTISLVSCRTISKPLNHTYDFISSFYLKPFVNNNFHYSFILFSIWFLCLILLGRMIFIYSSKKRRYYNVFLLLKNNIKRSFTHENQPKNQ